MTPEEELALGNRAERLKEDVQPYFDIVEAAILDAWRATGVMDRDTQHELKLMLKLLTDLQGNINTVIDTGKMAKIQIEQESLMSKAKNVIKAFR